MPPERLREIIERAQARNYPHIELIRRAGSTGERPGVFASSFNPLTVAHVELIARAARAFFLDERLAVAGLANADKTSYDCSLEDRLRMLELAFDLDPGVSIGLSSHAFYADMADALESARPQSDLHFIVGFDTFERVLDREDRYTARYHRRFSNRREALDYLFARGRFVVAARGGAGRREVAALLQEEPGWVGARVSYLDFPADLAERSATEVRERLRRGESIHGLVPAAVEQYIHERGLYR